MKKVLILGVNGFIGSSLTRAILDRKDWEVYGMDIGSHKLEDSLGNPRFKFVEGDVMISREWIEYHVKKCDAVIPLVAIANPAPTLYRWTLGKSLKDLERLTPEQWQRGGTHRGLGQPDGGEHLDVAGRGKDALTREQARVDARAEVGKHG